MERPTGLAGRRSNWIYDDFARLTEYDAPSSSTLGMSVASLNISYFDTTPFRRITAVTPDGVFHRTFLDALGDTVASVEQAGTSTNETWIVSGAHTRYATGLVSQVLRPFTTTTDPATTGSAATLPYVQPTGPARSFTYDGFGRTVSTLDYLGRKSTVTFHTASLTADFRDPEQQPGGGHPNAFTTLRQDGHGRLVETDEHISNGPNGPGVLSVVTAHQATGEPSTITLSSPQGSSQRIMQYDSLGRLEFSQEPNSGGMTYAYNDWGELDGFSDARGCGENIYHDGLGRVVAEDYSPCQSTQPAYSAPNLTTGVGTEAFNVYDADGYLVKTYDRAQFSQFGYDPRGRLTSVARQVAPPPASSSSSSSGGGGGGSTIQISGTVTDGSGNPISGAQVQLQLAGSNHGTATTDIDGHYVFPNLAPGSYSVLAPSVAGCTFIPNVVNLNGLTTSSVDNFAGSGSGTACGGPPVSTPIVAKGNLTIDGTVTNSGGLGVQGVAVTLSGSLFGTSPAVTHTDASGGYSFTGLGSGSYTLQPSQLDPGQTNGCTVTPGVANLNNLTSPGTVTQNFTASGSACSLGESSAGALLDGNYTPHVFSRSYQYDAVDRLFHATTGADVPQLAPSGAANSFVQVGFKFESTLDSMTSSYGTLLASQVVDEMGMPTQQLFGDAAKTTALLGYDANEQLVGYVLSRAAGTADANGDWASYAAGTSEPTAGDFTQQQVLASVALGYDKAGNPTSATQSTTATTASNGLALPAIQPALWPNGAKPVMSQGFSYWDDYRLHDVTTQYAGVSGATTDTFVSPYQAETLAGGSPYPPSPSSAPTTRVTDENFSYDWRGNITSWTDDVTSSGSANAFFDRSLGAVQNGTTSTAPGPDQLATATGSHGSGTLSTSYDPAGNLLSVLNTATNSLYTYAWDEIGRLATATRADNAQVLVNQSYAYTAGGERIRETQQLAGGAPTTHTLQVFDSLVLKGATFPAAPGDYERDAKTEQLYLGLQGTTLGHALYAPSLPSAASGNGALHVLMPFANRLGSTSFVVDHDTGELVEAPTYQPYGAVESDYRAARWKSPREDVRFNGHWDDAQVGLAYFGARYYAPNLGRFISPDPLTVAAPFGDSNPYAYASGSPILSGDPTGLQSDDDTTDDTVDTTDQGNGGDQAQELPPPQAGGPNLSDAELAACDDMNPACQSARAAHAAEQAAESQLAAQMRAEDAAARAQAVQDLVFSIRSAALDFGTGFLQGFVPGGAIVPTHGNLFWNGLGKIVGGYFGTQSGSFIAGGGALSLAPSGGTSTVAVAVGVAQGLNGAAAIGEGLAQLMAAAKSGGGAGGAGGGGRGSGGGAPRQTYNGVKNAPGYPKNFQTSRNGVQAVTTRNPVQNKALLEQLRQIEPGDWAKVYKDGWVGANRVSLHYFQSPSGQVFDFAIKPGWSN